MSLPSFPSRGSEGLGLDFGPYLDLIRGTGDSGEAERSFRREAERHSGMIPNTIGA